MENNTPKECVVSWKTGQAGEFTAGLLRLTRHLAVIEIISPGVVLQLSEVLNDFRILVDGRLAYSGRAVVAGVVDTGTSLVCEATLDEACLDPRALTAGADPARLREGFEEFIRDWGKSYRVLPEFKLHLMDLHNFLSDLRLWLEQVEMSVRAAPDGERERLEQQILAQLHKPVIAALNGLFEKFEVVAAKVEPQDIPAHRACARRLIHPLVFCSPFADRTFHKPLGYPGDYEMVNMILRDPFEGASLFAKIFNAWFISQPPAEAHRNRIKYLVKQLLQETARMAAQRREARIFSLGCGPAREVQIFLAEQEVSNHADFTLLDFNNDTIAYATGELQAAKLKHHRSTRINLLKKSVAQVLRGRGRSPSAGPEPKYDFVYCAGLFDYLTDSHCKQLMNIFYDMLAPGGLLVATNVDSSNPRCLTMDYMMEWVVIYRTGAQMAAFKPDLASDDDFSVQSDYTGVNLFLEVRKPKRE